jgi:hypothetical protein
MIGTAILLSTDFVGLYLSFFGPSLLFKIRAFTGLWDGLYCLGHSSFSSLGWALSVFFVFLAMWVPQLLFNFWNPRLLFSHLFCGSHSCSFISVLPTEERERERRNCERERRAAAILPSSTGGVLAAASIWWFRRSDVRAIRWWVAHRVRRFFGEYLLPSSMFFFLLSPLLMSLESGAIRMCDFRG